MSVRLEPEELKTCLEATRNTLKPAREGLIGASVSEIGRRVSNAGRQGEFVEWTGRHFYRVP